MSLAELATAGERGRAAATRLGTIGAELASALRRALPFLARKRVPIAIEPARCALFEDLEKEGKSGHLRAFVTQPNGVTGALLIDEAALTRIFEGVLGSASSPPKNGFTAAQNALALRLSEGMVKALSLATAKLGITLDGQAKASSPTGAAVVATLVIDGAGAIRIALPMAAVSVEDRGSAPPVCDGIARALIDVELDVIAELGRIRLPLAQLISLKVGDVVRLTLPLDEKARVVAGGVTLYEGRPTTIGDLVAIEIQPDETMASAVKGVTEAPIPIRHAA